MTRSARDWTPVYRAFPGSTSQRMRACKHQAVVCSPPRPPLPSAPRLLSPHLLLSTAAYRVHSSAQLLGVNRGLGYSVDSTDTISITALTAYCGDDTLTVGSARHVGPQRGNPTHALAGLAKPAHSPTARVVLYTLIITHTWLTQAASSAKGGSGGIVHAHLSYPRPAYHVPTIPRSEEPYTVDARG